MAKEITFSKEAREKLIKGVDVVASVVGCSLGPKGRNVVVGKQFGIPQIINDGISIAKEVELKDPLENAGAQLLKEVTSKTNDAAGDGTTTASILAQAIVHEGVNALEKGCNPIQMKDGINKAVETVVKYIESQSVNVDDTKLQHVATISAGNNKEIGTLIANAIKQVGDDGIVTVEESTTMGTTIKEADGMKLDKGYLSSYFVTDPEKMEAVLQNPYVLCVNKKINLVVDVIPILEMVAREGTPLLLVCEDLEGEALAAVVVNSLKKVVRIVAVKAPGFGDGRKGTLEDICVLTGGTLWTEEIGIELGKINATFFGRANRVVATKEDTTIVVDNKNNDVIQSHVESLRQQMKASTSDYEKERFQQRIARLTGGVAVIQVGAPTEVELKERKLRVEDALNATKAAKEEGIVSGGGFTLLQAQQACKRDWETSEEDTDYGVGYDILINSLHLPTKLIADNAGVEGDIVVEECKKQNKGYNALSRKYEDLMSTGVVDPAKVTKSALINAASIAAMLLTTEAAIIPIPDENASDAFVPHGAMPMM